MIIYSTRLGEVDVPDDEIIHFECGLPGFPDEKKFALLPYLKESPFAFLQSVTEPNLTFLVVDPFAYFHDYKFELDEQIAQEMGLSAENYPQIVSIVSVPTVWREMTANLLAPIVINVQSRKGTQIVLEKSNYTTRHRLFSNEAATQADTGGG